MSETREELVDAWGTSRAAIQALPDDVELICTYGVNVGVDTIDETAFFDAQRTAMSCGLPGGVSPRACLRPLYAASPRGQQAGLRSLSVPIVPFVLPQRATRRPLARGSSAG